MMLNRILGGDNQERLWQRIRIRVDSDLAFVHGLKQRRLGLWGGAVNLVCQQDVGKDRAAFEFKLLLNGRVNGNAEHVGRQHVTGELHALERAIDGARERLAERGFADARNAFDEQVATREDRH